MSALPGGGYLYVDYDDNLVRQVSAAGVVTTVAGNETRTDAPDGTVAVNSGLNGPVSVAALPQGGFLITEYDGSVVRMVTSGAPGSATISTIAGTGTPGQGGSGGAATSTALAYPTDAEPTAAGGVLIADAGDNSVRLVSSAAPGATIATVAGGGGGGGCDDATATCQGASAGGVELHNPVAVSPIAGGSSYLIAEYDTDAIRQVSDTSTNGTFTTVAGTPGSRGYAGDGGPGTAALLDHPEGVTSIPSGGFLISDTSNEVVRSVAADGTISTVAGNGADAFGGDGGAATNGSLATPVEVAIAPDGGFVIADSDNNALREVTIPPVTSVTASQPDGQNGWDIAPPTLTVTAARASATRCVIDPPVAPTLYDELPSECPYASLGTTVTGDGMHTLYAASVDWFGDKEIPVSATVKIDATPPVVTCAAAMTPSFVFGTAGTIAATVSDAISGPVAPAVSAGANTASLGPQKVSITGANNAGIRTSAECPYIVNPAQLDPAPALSRRFEFVRPARAHPRDARFLVKALTVTAPAGSTVTVTCHGHSCPFASSVHTLGAPPASCIGATPCPGVRPVAEHVALQRAFGKHVLAAGTIVTVAVTQDGAVGRIYTLTLPKRGHRVGSSVACLPPGAVAAGESCKTALADGSAGAEGGGGGG